MDKGACQAIIKAVEMEREIGSYLWKKDVSPQLLREYKEALNYTDELLRKACSENDISTCSNCEPHPCPYNVHCSTV